VHVGKKIKVSGN